jgi:hypothetical protein
MATVQEILDTEIPRPTFAFRPGYNAPVPSDVTFSRPTGGRTLDPASELYKFVSSGKRRIFGPQQGLLVESGNRTNEAKYSSDISQWGTSSGATIESGTPLDSVIGGEDAYKITADTSSEYARARRIDSGIYTSGEEVVYAILEKDTADRVAVGLANDTNSSSVIGTYEFSTDSIVSTDYIIDANTRKLTTSGPNGGTLVLIILRYDATSVGGNDVSGDNRRQQIFPDRNNNGNGVIAHHAQIETRKNASSPIVTGSSETNRQGDDVTIFSGGQPDWWNPNQGTFLMEASLRFFERGGATRLLSGNSRAQRYFGVGSNPVGIFSADDDGNSVVFSPVDPFSKLRLGVSFDNDDIRLGVNGDVRTAGGHDGSFMTPSELEIGINNRLLATVFQLRYIPEALSKSTLGTLIS